jgi:hypothetical protein
LPIDGFMEAASKRPGASVSDIGHEQKDGIEIQSFSLTDAKGGTYFRLIRSKATQYMLVVQFPEASRRQATSMKDDFFGSFEVMR